MSLYSNLMKNLRESTTGDGVEVDRFAKDLETALIDRGYRVKTSDYRMFTISKDNKYMVIGVYDEEDPMTNGEGAQIGLGGDTAEDQTVYPIFQRNWDVEDAAPSPVKHEDGDVVYAEFQKLANTSINEVVTIIDNSFANTSTEDNM